MKKIFVSSVVGLGLLLPCVRLQAQVITIGGSVLGRPVAITGRASVRFEQLPPNVQQTIRSQAGGGVVAGVERGTYSGPAYRVTFVQYGGVRTLQFTSNGSVLSGDGGLIADPLNDARTIRFQQLPAAVRQSVVAEAAGGEITSVDQGIYRGPVYDALVQAPGSSPQHVIVTQSGGLLQGATVNESAGANVPANSDAAAAARTQTGQITGTLAFQDLGWSVQKPMLDRTGYAHIDTVQQITNPD
ncbi:MAG: hypothetical protein ACXWIU_04440, partial [Limisphaerales bacterium]